MKTFIQILNILLISLLIYNFYNTIEPYCNSKLNKDELAENCHTQQIYDNKEKTEMVNEKITGLKKILNVIKEKINANTKSTLDNTKTMQKLNNISAGKEIDNSEACKKYPEAC